MQSNTRRILCLAALAATFACTRMADEVPLYEISSPTSEYSLGYLAGELSIDILSNGEYTASLPEGTDWIRFPGGLSGGGKGDGSISLSYDTNRSIPRRVELSLVRGTNSATVLIVQDGLLEGGIELAEKCLSVPSEGGEARVRAHTLISEEELSISIAYEEEGEEWLRNPRLSGHFLSFTASANLSPDSFRHAVLTVSGGEASASLRLTQLPSGLSTESISLAGLKAKLGSAGQWVADRHYLLEAQVLNDFSEGNGAENRNTSADTPDREWKYRVLYLQDGSEGIKATFSSRCDALVQPFGKVVLDLYGLTLTREESPLRYTISDIPAGAILSSGDGAEITPKILNISELSEANLYTLVSVEGVEIPFRKGPYMPIDIRYVSLITANAVPLRDASGNTLPMMINADCSFARDGKAMPQGSGTVTGVLVHESCDHLEWDTDAEAALEAKGIYGDYITGIGNIGALQLRPMKEADIELSQDSFSSILYEWRYCDALGENLVRNYDTTARVLFPTLPAVADPLSLEAEFYCMGSDGEKAALGLCNDFTHIGPYIFGGTITEPENGNGVTDLYGRSAHWNVWPTVSTIGVIYSGSAWETSNGSAWQVSGWSTGKYWCAEFSTDGLSASNSPLSVQFGTMGCTNGPGAPRYWAVECSADGSSWTKAASYTVPDFPTASTKRVWQMPGTKYISVNLPDELLGKDKVYVRLRPSSAISGSLTAYEGSKSITASRYNAINYFAIRYNP